MKRDAVFAAADRTSETRQPRALGWATVWAASYLALIGGCTVPRESAVAVADPNPFHRFKPDDVAEVWFATEVAEGPDAWLSPFTFPLEDRTTIRALWQAGEAIERCSLVAEPIGMPGLGYQVFVDRRRRPLAVTAILCTAGGIEFWRGSAADGRVRSDTMLYHGKNPRYAWIVLQYLFYNRPDVLRAADMACAKVWNTTLYEQVFGPESDEVTDSRINDLRFEKGLVIEELRNP